MSNALMKPSAEITNDPYAFHNINIRGAKREYRHPITNTGKSILDDVEAHLGEMGAIGETYFTEALSALATVLLGEDQPSTQLK